jgi:transposase
MMMLSTAVRVYIAAAPIDMRKSIDSLSMLVRPMFDQDALSGHVFVFYGRRRDKIKVLVYDRTGFWLMYKRSRAARWPIPRPSRGGGFRLPNSRRGLKESMSVCAAACVR